jgi:hypothetical protein
MSILIDKVLERTAATRSMVCLATHHDHQVQVTLVVKDVTLNYEGRKLIFEMSYEHIKDCKQIVPYAHEMSGIFPNPDSADCIDIVGEIHNVIEVDGEKGFDLYLLNDADFIYIDAKDLKSTQLNAGDGVRLTLLNLRIYPSE